MIDINSEEYKELERRCKQHTPAYDPERLIQLSNALKHMIIKYKHYSDGSRQVYLTCYKSKKKHHSSRTRHRDNF